MFDTFAIISQCDFPRQSSSPNVIPPGYIKTRWEMTKSLAVSAVFSQCDFHDRALQDTSSYLVSSRCNENMTNLISKLLYATNIAQYDFCQQRSPQYIIPQSSTNVWQMLISYIQCSIFPYNHSARFSTTERSTRRPTTKLHKKMIECDRNIRRVPSLLFHYSMRLSRQSSHDMLSHQVS